MDKAKIEALYGFFFFISGYSKAVVVWALAVKLALDGWSTVHLLLALVGAAYTAGRFDAHLWALGKLK